MSPKLGPFADVDHAAAVAGNVDGARRAADAIKAIRTGAGGGDALLRAVLNMLSADGFTLPPTARLRAFSRVLQTALAEAPPIT